MTSNFRDLKHNARLIVLQRLFARDFSDINFPDLETIDEITKVDEELAEKIYAGVLQNFEKIDKIITSLAPEWPDKEIAKLDMQILRIAVFEGFIEAITPEKVAVDEAIELAKEFSNDQSRKFISGILGNLIKNKEKILKK